MLVDQMSKPSKRSIKDHAPGCKQYWGQYLSLALHCITCKALWLHQVLLYLLLETGHCGYCLWAKHLFCQQRWNIVKRCLRYDYQGPQELMCWLWHPLRHKGASQGQAGLYHVRVQDKIRIVKETCTLIWLASSGISISFRWWVSSFTLISPSPGTKPFAHRHFDAVDSDAWGLLCPEDLDGGMVA